jgi:hypothetical protein
MLEDFICEAVRDPAVPQASPLKQGQNEGIHVIQQPGSVDDDAMNGKAAGSNMDAKKEGAMPDRQKK